MTTRLGGYGYRRHVTSTLWCGPHGGWPRGGAPASAPAVAVWTIEQLTEFLAFVRGDRLFALW